VTNFFEKIFEKFRKPDDLEGTKPLSPPDERIEDDATKPLEPIPEVIKTGTIPEGGFELPQLIAGCGQSVGQQRDHNEDALFALTTTLANNSSNLPFGLYVVADGMGGHQHGEVASEIATRAMAEYVIRNLYTSLISVEPHPPAESLQEIISNGI
jgi:hypothetical protein